MSLREGKEAADSVLSFTGTAESSSVCEKRKMPFWLNTKNNRVLFTLPGDR